MTSRARWMVLDALLDKIAFLDEKSRPEILAELEQIDKVLHEQFSSLLSAFEESEDFLSEPAIVLWDRYSSVSDSRLKLEGGLSEY